MRKSPLLLACTAMAVALSSAVAQTAPQITPRIAPSSPVWSSDPIFAFDLPKKKAVKTRQSLSGIACSLNAAQERVCLMAFDEGEQASFAKLGSNSLQPLPEPVVLRSGDGELDAEGAATDGQYFYVTGSHSAKRSSCKSNPDSRHVLRFQRDPATGLALRTADGALAGYADSGRLWDILQAQPALAAHVGERKCLGAEPPPDAPALQGQRGINIEGLAVRAGRLYFGFRGPTQDGQAGVLAVDSQALFQGDDAHPALTQLVLGSGRGVRDMLAVSDGFLVLAGPDDDPSHQNSVDWTVSWWDGQPSKSPVTPRVLATLDLRAVQLRSCDKELKPEAITLLAETPQAYQLLVLSDGMCDGGALTFSVPR
ncbi:MAG: DUF3616 domain-containing protein [Burkholderiales bacterium]|nr:DUF3616 domain-containing protein [Burkholderiales bacterium]